MSKDLIEFSKEEKQLIMSQFFPSNTSPVEMQFCMGVAKELGLNPITKEIWFVERKSQVNGQWVTKIEPMAGRDSYLKIAHRSGQFGGIEAHTEIQEVSKLENGKWIETKDLVAICNVYKKGIERPFSVSVNYNEYVQKKRDGTPTKFWNEKPHTMIKKVAESQALRKAFNISGVYSDEEISDKVNRNDMPTIEDAEIIAEIEQKPSLKLLKLKLSNQLKEISFSDSDIKEFAEMFGLSEDMVAIESLINDKELLMSKVAEFEGK